jgi:hypothetical protein
MGRREKQQEMPQEILVERQGAPDNRRRPNERPFFNDK